MTDYTKLSRSALESHARAYGQALKRLASDCIKREAELRKLRLRLASIREVRAFFHGK